MAVIRKYFAGQAPLAAVEEVTVPGLYYLEDTVKDERQLVEAIDSQEWGRVSASRTARKVQHYGYRYDYSGRSAPELIGPLPSFLEPLRDTLHATCLRLGLIDNNYTFNQCIINDYEPGQGIAPHIDSPFFGEVIGCFTLQGAATMEFSNGSKRYDLYAKPGSLYIMSGEARHTWKHGMTARKSDTIRTTRIARTRRISVTFRSTTHSE